MKLREIQKKLNLNVLTAQDHLETEVHSAYTSDLLSDVMAHAQGGTLWITLQTHQNVIAVAKLKELAGVILVNNREPEEETRNKAEEENIPLLTTPENAFHISGKIYRLLGIEK